jgi:hypothetical protein
MELSESMMWTNDQLKKMLPEKLQKKVRFKTNNKVFYNKFYHKATFEFKTRSENGYNQTDWVRGQAMFRSLEKTMTSDIRCKMDFCEGRVYFTDYNDLIANLRDEDFQRLLSVEIMPEQTIAAINDFKHEYQVILSVVKSLPFDTYRYKVHINTSSKIRKQIGTQNLGSIVNLLAAYDGIRITESFAIAARATRPYSSSTYFYCKDLEWLPMIILMDPRYIKRIEQLKTQMELNDEIANQNTN